MHIPVQPLPLVVLLALGMALVVCARWVPEYLAQRFTCLGSPKIHTCALLRGQVAAQLLAPAVLLLALGAALLTCAGHGGALGSNTGVAEPDQAAALLRDIVAPVLSLLGLAACLCWPLGAAAAFWSPAPAA